MFKKMIISIIVFILFYCLSIQYMNVYHTFWSKQPVSFYHFLKLKEGIITLNKPSNTLKKEDYKVDHILESDLEDIKHLLNNHYSDHSLCQYNYSKEYLQWFLNSDKQDRINLKISLGKDLIGSLTARPITIIIKNIKRCCLYADNLCIKKEYQQKNLVPILISHLIDKGFDKGYNLFIFQLENRRLPFRSITNNINSIYRIPHNNIDDNNYKIMDNTTIKKAYIFYTSYFKDKKNYIYYSYVEFYNFFMNEWTNTYLEFDNDNIINMIVVYNNQYTLEKMKVIEIPYILMTQENSLLLKKIMSIYYKKGFRLICNKNNHYKQYFKEFEHYNKFISYIYMYNYHLQFPIYNHYLTFF